MMTRKWFAFWMCLLAAINTRAAELANPSFEQPGQSPDQAAHWERWGSWINRETEWKPVKDGKAVLGYHHWKLENSERSGVWQDVAGVKAGERYTFSVQANRDAVKEGFFGAENIELRMESTFDGHQLTIQVQSYKVSDIASGGDWSTLRVTGTAATDSLRVMIAVYPAGQTPRDGAVKFDAAKLELR